MHKYQKGLTMHNHQTPHARVYGRGSTLKQVITTKDQCERGEKYFKERLAAKGIAWGGLYPDDATTSGIPLVERRYGGALIRDLKPGDHIIVTDLDRLFRNMVEAVAMIDAWVKDKIVVHITEWGLDTSTEVGQIIVHFLVLVAHVERRMIRERTRRAMQHIKRRPDAIKNQNAPPGFRLDGQKGHRRVVPDQQQRDIMALIVRLRDEQYLSFAQIALEFIRGGMNNPKTGRQFHASGIHRWYMAAKKLANEHAEAAGVANEPASV